MHLTAMRRRAVAQRTGIDMSDEDPDDLAARIFARPQSELMAMRAGAFFILCDDYSKTSDVVKRLQTTNIALPSEQFFDTEGVCLQPGIRDLYESVRTFITEERLGEAYALTRKGFAKEIFNLSNVQTLATILLATGPALSEAIGAVKTAFGNFLGW